LLFLIVREDKSVNYSVLICRLFDLSHSRAFGDAWQLTVQDLLINILNLFDGIDFCDIDTEEIVSCGQTINRIVYYIIDQADLLSFFDGSKLKLFDEAGIFRV
jgi:hypothetical protein